MYPFQNFLPEVMKGSLAWTLSSRAFRHDGPDRRSRSARSTLSSNTRPVDSSQLTVISNSKSEY
jgi:hypothetical protein